MIGGVLGDVGMRFNGDPLHAMFCVCTPLGAALQGRPVQPEGGGGLGGLGVVWFWPAALAGVAGISAAGAYVANRAKSIVDSWGNLKESERGIAVTELQTECMQAVRAGDLSAADCATITGYVQTETSTAGGKLSAFFGEHGPVILAGVLTVALSAVVVRAVK